MADMNPLASDIAHHKAERFVTRSSGRSDLIHNGKPRAKSMRRRLEQFLWRPQNRDHVHREASQKFALMTKYRIWS